MVISADFADIYSDASETTSSRNHLKNL